MLSERTSKKPTKKITEALKNKGIFLSEDDIEQVTLHWRVLQDMAQTIDIPNITADTAPVAKGD